jgi:hypothetical protein
MKTHKRVSSHLTNEYAYDRTSCGKAIRYPAANSRVKRNWKDVTCKRCKKLKQKRGE